MHLTFTIKEKIMYFLSHFPSFRKSTHVRMSEEGYRVLNNSELASKVVDTIIQHKKDLDEGKVVQVDGENFSIGTVTSIPEKDS